MEKKHIKLTALLLLFALNPFSALAATLSVSPASGVHSVGEKFTVRTLVSSDVPFNAVSLSLLFPTSIFTLDSVSKTGSLLSFWVKEPTISRSEGTLKLEGVTPGGIKETTGMVVAVTLHAHSVGSGTVSFLSGQVLANDGEGTNITGDMTGANFTIVAAKPKPVITPGLTVTPEIVIEPEVTQPTPSLTPPEIMLGTKYGAQAVTGTSEYAKIQVLLTFVSPDGSKIFIMGNTEQDGTFTFVVPRSLKRGNYTVTARLIQEDGLNSKDSNSIALTVGGPFSDMSWETKLILFLLFLLILLIILYLIYHFRRDEKKRIAVKKEVEEAQNTVHESLDSLQKELMDRLHEKTADTDIKILTETSHDIERIEKKIEKEIGGIEMD